MICNKSSFQSSLVYHFLAAILLATFCSSQAAAQYGETAPIAESLKPGYDAISSEQCKEWLSLLAGEKFAGRGTGQPGYTKAAHWVSGKLAEFGVEPMGNGGSYFQMLPMTRKIPVPADCKIEGPGGLEISGEDDLGFSRYSEQAQVGGKIALVTMAGDNPQFAGGVSLRDKVVILLTDDDSDFRKQIPIIRQQPAAVIMVAEKPESQSQLVRGGRTRTPGTWSSISPDAANRLMDSLGVERSWLEGPTEDGGNVTDIDAEVRVTVRLREEQVVVPNVIGWLEGSDPEVNDEYIVLGAHLDHLGTRGDELFNGADDNASGSTAILNVAKAMSENPVKPRRSVMFMWFAAEEIGLVGSRYYTDNPTQPLEKCICMFNCDMVGRNEETQEETAAENEGSIHLVGSRKGDENLHNIIMDANRSIGFRFEYDQEGVFGRSDQANFYRAGIPVAFLFGGFHPDYHRTGDDIEKINYKKVASAARLFYLSIYKAAEFGEFARVPQQ